MKAMNRGSILWRSGRAIAACVASFVLVTCSADEVITNPDTETVAVRDTTWQLNQFAEARWLADPALGLESLSVELRAPAPGAMLIGFRLEIENDSTGQGWQLAAADSTLWVGQNQDGMIVAAFEVQGGPLPRVIHLTRPVAAGSAAPGQPNVELTQLAVRTPVVGGGGGALVSAKVSSSQFRVFGPAGLEMGDSTGHQISTWGDLDRSGVVDFADAVLAAEAGVGVVDTASITIGVGDADSSGTVTTRDALIIARFVAGLALHPYLGQAVGPQVAVVQPGVAVTVMHAGGASVEIGSADLTTAATLVIEEVPADTSESGDSPLGPAFAFTVSDNPPSPVVGMVSGTAGFRGSLRLTSGAVSGAGRAVAGAPTDGPTGSSLAVPLYKTASGAGGPDTYIQYSSVDPVNLSTAPLFGYSLSQVVQEATGKVLRAPAELGGWIKGQAKTLTVKVQALYRSATQCPENIHLYSEAAPSSGTYLNVVLIHGIQLVGGSTFLNCSYFDNNSPLNGFWYEVRDELLLDYPQLTGKLRVHRFVYPTFNSPTLAGTRLASMLSSSATAFGGQPIMLVGHSMGGLVAAEALKLSPNSSVVRLATFGTPFAGSVLAEPATATTVCLATVGVGTVIPTPATVLAGALGCAGAVYLLYPTPGLKSLRPDDDFIKVTLRGPQRASFTPLQAMYSTLAPRVYCRCGPHSFCLLSRDEIHLT